METKTKDHPAGWKGYGREDYVQAQKAGSIRAAAQLLGVSRSTVREQWKRYGIVNPVTGNVPGKENE